MIFKKDQIAYFSFLLSIILPSPSSQLLPVNPVAHTQLCPVGSSWQVPSFLQGFGIQNLGFEAVQKDDEIYNEKLLSVTSFVRITTSGSK
jgi:hypothetical protein